MAGSSKYMRPIVYKGKFYLSKLINWLNRPIFRFVILPGIIMYVALLYITGLEQTPNTSGQTPAASMTGVSRLKLLLPSFLTALLGWLNSASMSHKGFVKSEASKSMDAISIFVDKLFDDFDGKLNSKAEGNQIEDFVTGRVTILELKLRHIVKRTGIQLINNQDISRLRELPLKNNLIETQQLRFELLELIEINYSDWVSTEKI